MPYGEIVRVRAPIEAYHALHKQISELMGSSIPAGAIVHIARPTDDGFEVIEVWESKEQADAFNRDVLGPAIAKVGAEASGPEPQIVGFEPTTAITFKAYSSEQVR